MVHLPRAVHLVAETPDLDAVGILGAVLLAQVAPVAAAGMVAVFEHRQGFGEALGAEVDREHRLGAGLAAPADELVGADLVVLRRAPGEIEPHRPLLARANTVFPIVVGDEVAAGITHQRRLQIAHEAEHVAPESIRVGRLVAGLVDAAVDRAAEMFEKGAVDPIVNRTDHKILMN